MYPKPRPVPPEVSSWMEKDLALGELTAATRLLTNDARQNIIVSRRFFSDLLSLSFERYRKILACNYDKKTFLKNQRTKSETSMPGLRPYVDKLTANIDGVTTSGIQSNTNDGNSLTSPSVQSFFSRPETKSDLAFNRRPHTSIQRVKTAQSMRSQPDRTSISIPKRSNSQRPQTGQPMVHERLRQSAQPMKSQGDITPIITSKKPTHQRPVTRQQISRERLDYLAQPKNYRFKSAGTSHIRPYMNEQTPMTDGLLGEFDKKSQTQLEKMHDTLLEKCDNAVHSECFRHLVDGFSKVHHAETSNSQTVRSIIQGNTSLQDGKGHWKKIHPTAGNFKPVFKHRRQTLADKLNNKIDIFLIDVGA